MALKWGNCVFVSKHIELIRYGEEMKRGFIKNRAKTISTTLSLGD